MKVVTVSLSLALLVGCSPTPNPVDPAPTSDCEGACHQFNVFGCEEGKPSPENGVKCVAWCAEYHADDYMPPFAECASKATTVDAMRACGVKCEEGK